MADWNKPGLTDQYADVLTLIKALATDAATLFSGSPTNQPTGSIRYNRSTNLLEEYNGTSWAVKTLSIAGGGTGATTASGARSALSAAASGANADITSLTAVTAVTAPSALTVEASGANTLTLKSGAGALSFVAGGQSRHTMSSSGHIIPADNDAYDIGQAAALIRKIFVGELRVKNLFWTNTLSEFFPDTTDGSDNKALQIGHPDPSRGALAILGGNESSSTGSMILKAGNVTGGIAQLGTVASEDIILSSANTSRWRVKADGDLWPESTNTHDIGDSTKKVKDIYLAGDLKKDNQTWSPTLTTPGGMSSSGYALYQANYNKLGAFVMFDLAVVFTLTGTASNWIKLSLPVAGQSHNANTALICNIDSPSGTVANGGRWRQDGTDFYIFKPGNANFELGETKIHIQGLYRYV